MIIACDITLPSNHLENIYCKGIFYLMISDFVSTISEPFI